MKLWQKDSTNTLEQVQQFTVGRDQEFDILLAKYDVQGNIAHVRMLGEVGLLTSAEAEQAIAGLHEIAKEIEAGTFCIATGVEDIHSQVEFSLTEKIGAVGKKIHSGRSRNDQVAVDLKLFFKTALKELAAKVNECFATLQKQSEAHKDILLPGYTHLQIAMPSSAGLWLGAYAESLVDDMQLVVAAYEVSNRNPLGSGAGYGSSFPLNRLRTTELLEFASLNYNSIYAQMTRGKTEKFVAIALAQVASTLAKLSMDCCLYMNQNFGFITFPDELTTGSSLMPHKKNPDVFELIRGKCNRLQSLPNEMTLLLTNLPSGYHREMQLTKEIIFPALQSLNECLSMTVLMLQNIKFSENILQEPKYSYLFSVEALNELVNKGVPFRDAYAQIGNSINEGTFQYDQKSLNHTHEGSIGNLCTAQIKALMDSQQAKIQ